METSKNKIKTFREIEKIARRARVKRKKIVTTNGCFDILHIGHVDNLEWAKSRGNILIVGINSDKSVRANKGPSRPIVPASERARVLAGLAAVDYIFIFGGKSPIPWLKKIRPHFQVKGRGSEQSPAFALEEKVVADGGGRVLLAPRVKKRSTTRIVKKILRIPIKRENF